MSDSDGVEQGALDAAEAGRAATTEAIRRRSRAYHNGQLVAEDFPLEMCSEWSEASDAMVWFDLPDPTPEELETLREELGLHSLAIEDATHLQQRPKLDRYDGHLVLSAYRVRAIDAADLDAAMILGFITPKALITVHQAGVMDLDALTRHWDDNADLAKFGVPFLVYGLLDSIVDGYFDALQALDDTLEDLSDQIFDAAAGHESATALRRTFELRKGILTARRVISPMREVVNALMRRDWTSHTPDLMPYYQDLYDHVLRAADWTDNLRDLLGTVRETQLTIQGNRMNLIMKKVTSWAAIIAVPTAVTGFYGQNVPYPGFDTHDGFWVSTLLIVVLSALLYWSFKRRDWL
ncbi:magnesium transporter CorA family protein [Actinospica robiniae]|uniref:magnesium transporter CorA family protein n=1 Tax=Actinospica robiniae TaxID=304901 RepID=UPI0004243FB0|nr:magnesium transporter CorA family protein [Actinospica robiniae]